MTDKQIDKLADMIATWTIIILKLVWLACVAYCVFMTDLPIDFMARALLLSSFLSLNMAASKLYCISKEQR